MMNTGTSRERLKKWLSMLDTFPAQTFEGKLLDNFWKGFLEAELEDLERMEHGRAEQTANALRGSTNKLRELKRC